GRGVSKTTVCRDTPSVHHIRQHECLAYTLLHARHTRVNFVTLEKIVDIVLLVGYSSRGRSLVMQQCRWRIPPQAGRRQRRSWRVEVERMAAKTLGMKGNSTGSRGLWCGRDMDNHVSERPMDPLARELARYAVVGGLASLVDVGLLVGLTSGGGVYYLHAAAIAFSCGLLTSYLLSIAWVFQARTW